MRKTKAEKILIEYYRKDFYNNSINSRRLHFERIIKAAIVFSFTMIILLPFNSTKSKINLTGINTIYAHEINNITTNFKMRGEK